MSDTINRTQFIHDPPRVFPQEGRGAEAWPRTGAWRARSTPRNTQARNQLADLLNLAPESKNRVCHTSRPRTIEADKTPSRGEGSSDLLAPETTDHLHTEQLSSRNTHHRDNTSRPDYPHIIPSQLEREIEEQMNALREDANDASSDSEYDEPEDELSLTGQFFMHTTSPTPRHAQEKRLAHGKKLGKTVGSINIRGRTMREDITQRKHDSMSYITTWMKEQTIDILALLDTHWDDEILEQHRRRYTYLEIFETHMSTNRAGIALLVDKRTETPQKIDFDIIEEGRSAVITIKFNKQTITLAAVYAPTDNRAKSITFEKLRNTLRTHPNKTNLILAGDFNMVESSIDRNPRRDDDPRVTRSLRKLINSLNLEDGWRKTNPNEIQYSWMGNGPNETHTFARLDRIYVSESLMSYTNEWKINRMERSVTDHAAISVKILEPDPPFIGQGEWRLNMRTIREASFREEATKLLYRLEAEIAIYTKQTGRSGLRTSPERTKKIRENGLNPQKSWLKYKSGLEKAARDTDAQVRKRILATRRKIESEIKRIEFEMERAPSEESQAPLRAKLAKRERDLSDLTGHQRKKAEATAAAKWFKENETGSKLWYSLKKERPQRQIFHSLLDTNGEEQSGTDEMLRIAQKHHEKLQKCPGLTPERLTAINKLCEKVEPTVDPEDAAHMAKHITYQDVLQAIKRMPTGKAPGSDGIPLEFWNKSLNG
ncbi:related to Pol-like protein-Ciona intestinalis [Serendipita indica DSM 11827]|uniref:Related to Pol-like protein-Ciona intestinalis n=1 Tax=Serendipita indica (strain DSM 11827) TaxID=1109443 RepID=G4T6M5_SERID|nr:related to Pol-like protein-Ciona intestinalis [Serendipita indica DSM 11827]